MDETEDKRLPTQSQLLLFIQFTRSKTLGNGEEGRKILYEDIIMGSTLSMFSSDMISARQHCIAIKIKGKPYLLANWAPTQYACRQVWVMHPTSKFI